MQLSSPGLWNISVTGASSRANVSNGAAWIQQNKLAPAAKDSVHFGGDFFDDPHPDNPFTAALDRIVRDRAANNQARANLRSGQSTAAFDEKEVALADEQLWLQERVAHPPADSPLAKAYAVLRSVVHRSEDN